MRGESNATTTGAPGVWDPPVSTSKTVGLVRVFPPPHEGEAPQVWKVGRAATLGRGTDCEILVEDASVSRVHASVAARRDQLVVSDAGSRFGTFTDGKRVGAEPTEMPVGTVLRVGNTLLLVVEGVEQYAMPFRRLAASFIGLQHDVFAGPRTWAAWQSAMRASGQSHLVLVRGESGSGKEIVARLLYLSRPQPWKWVSVNLAAVPDTLFEAELFGHARGAFTGATHARLGAFREADGGTLFLDEIGELRPELQVKLLRALETKTVRPLGADGDVSVAVRVVAATNRDIEAAVSEGTLRSDLYYRLSAMTIQVPPLRERKEEIPVIAATILQRELPGAEISPSAAEHLLLRPWLGNARELHHVVVRAAGGLSALGASTLLPEHLPECPRKLSAPSSKKIALTIDGLRQAIESAAGNATKAAELLGVSRATLYNFCSRNQVELASLRAEVELRDAGAGR